MNAQHTKMCLTMVHRIGQRVWRIYDTCRKKQHTHTLSPSLLYEFRLFFSLHKVKIQEQNYWRIFATLYIFSNHLRIPFNLPHSFRYWTGFYMCEAKFIWSWREKKPHRININHVKNSEKERKLLK